MGGRDYREPILRTVLDLGGHCTSHEGFERLHERVAHRLTEFDHLGLVSDPKRPRWRGRAYGELAKLRKEGLLVTNSPRHTWRITDAGRAWLAEQAAPTEDASSP